MKKAAYLFVAAGLLIGMSSAGIAEEGHDHDHAKKTGHPDHDQEHAGGPRGGRLLENTEPRAELLVEKDSTVSIAFYDDSMKPMEPSGQSALLIVETHDTKAELEFEHRGGVLITKGPLPEGESHSVVLRLKASPEAKPRNYRMTLDGKICPDCARAEYACVCAH